MYVYERERERKKREVIAKMTIKSILLKCLAPLKRGIAELYERSIDFVFCSLTYFFLFFLSLLNVRLNEYWIKFPFANVCLLPYFILSFNFFLLSRQGSEHPDEREKKTIFLHDLWFLYYCRRLLIAIMMIASWYLKYVSRKIWCLSFVHTHTHTGNIAMKGFFSRCRWQKEWEWEHFLFYLWHIFPLYLTFLFFPFLSLIYFHVFLSFSFSFFVFFLLFLFFCWQ